MQLAQTNPPLTPPRRGTRQPVSLPSLEGLGVGSWSQCIRKNDARVTMNRTNFECARSHRKRRRAAALQDAGALATVAGTSARFWSEPPLRRFGIARQVRGPNARPRCREGFPCAAHPSAPPRERVSEGPVRGSPSAQDPNAYGNELLNPLCREPLPKGRAGPDKSAGVCW